MSKSSINAVGLGFAFSPNPEEYTDAIIFEYVLKHCSFSPLSTVVYFRIIYSSNSQSQQRKRCCDIQTYINIRRFRISFTFCFILQTLSSQVKAYLKIQYCNCV